jgi:GLTT repeat (6 copies)
MLQTKSVLVAVAMAGTASTLGCGEAPTEDVAQAGGALTSANGLFANGLFANGLFANGLFANGLFANGLFANGLFANGLFANGLVVNGLADPTAEKVMEYVVSCALPTGDSVTYSQKDVTYTFGGWIGVAPEWKTKTCDVSCQHWVSACVLSRLNYLGMHRPISIRGDNKALAIAPTELAQYTHREATYYGNLFVTGQPRFACLPPKATEITRVCGDSLTDCAVDVVGACEDFCDDHGAFGTYNDCNAARTSSKGRAKHAPDYAETVTVFLP